MTVFASVHQPSSETFHLFDRVIVLAEGRTIYNGSTHNVMEFLTKLGHK